MDVKPGYKRTEVGLIPVEWNVRSIEDAFQVCNHLRLPLSQTVRERIAGQYPYYGPTAVQGWINEYRVEGEYALIGEDGDHFLKWQCQPMTLLVRGKFNVNNHAHLVRGKENLTEWFYWFFANRDVTRYLTRQGAGRYKLTKATLLKIPCALPPPPEQRAIAEALSDVDALLSGLDRLIAKKRDLKQAAMQQLLTGQTRLPGFRGKWDVKRLGEVVETDPENLGSATSPNYSFRYISLEDVDCGTLRNFSEQVFATAPTRARRKLRRNDVLVSTVRPNLRSHLLFQSGESDWICSTGFCVVRCREGITHPGFIFQHLFAITINRQIEALLTGSNYPSMNGRDVRALELPVPSFAEQNAIAEVLTEIDAELTALEKRREKTHALKQAMMQELLTGRTRLVSAERNQHAAGLASRPTGRKEFAPVPA